MVVAIERATEPAGKERVRKCPCSAVPKPAPDPNMRRIVEACWKMNTPEGYRDAFVCAAHLGDRLSAAEILNLRNGDIDTRTGEVMGLRRVLQLGELTKRALIRWSGIRNDRTGPIVQPLRGRRKGKSAPEQLVYDIVRRGAARQFAQSPKASIQTFI
jgi:integrase